MLRSSILVFWSAFLIPAYAGQGGTACGEGDPPAIGSPCPDFVFESVANFPSHRVRMSELRGKAVILDLWGTWCGSCVAALPKVDAIQNDFREKLQVVLISSEKPEKVQAFLNKLDATHGIRLTSAIDTGFTIGKALGVRFVPHYLWVDAKGIIRAATDEKAITHENVRKLVEGGPLPDLPIKRDEPRAPESLYGSLFDPELERSGQLVSAAVIVGSHPGQSSTVTTYGQGPFAGRRLRFTRYPVAALLAFAAGQGKSFSENRIILEHCDTLRLWPDIAKEPDSLKKMHFYNYELLVQSGKEKELYAQMEQDLCNRFSLHVRREKRAMPCLVLRTKKAHSLQQASKSSGLDQSAFWFVMRAQPIEKLIEAIRTYSTGRRIADVVDHTGLAGRYDLKLYVSFSNIPALTNALGRMGILLSEEMRDVEVLVLSSTNKP